MFWGKAIRNSHSKMASDEKEVNENLSGVLLSQCIVCGTGTTDQNAGSCQNHQPRMTNQHFMAVPHVRGEKADENFEGC